jgi:hypothetical protein
MFMENKILSISTIRQEVNLREAQFEEVFPIWRDYLWPGRKSPIKEISPLQADLTFDPKILGQTAYFFALENRDRVVGVISGYKTSALAFRIRGLYIFPEYRKLHLSHLLFEEICKTAKKNGAKLVWSIPRQSAWKSYKSFGFYLVSDWFSEGMEFGPNGVAQLDISQFE